MDCFLLLLLFSTQISHEIGFILLERNQSMWEALKGTVHQINKICTLVYNCFARFYTYKRRPSQRYYFLLVNIIDAAKSKQKERAIKVGPVERAKRWYFWLNLWSEVKKNWIPGPFSIDFIDLINTVPVIEYKSGTGGFLYSDWKLSRRNIC